MAKCSGLSQSYLAANQNETISNRHYELPSSKKCLKKCRRVCSTMPSRHCQPFAKRSAFIDQIMRDRSTQKMACHFCKLSQFASILVNIRKLAQFVIVVRLMQQAWPTTAPHRKTSWRQARARGLCVCFQVFI